MHSYLRNLAGLHIFLEISKFLKKIGQKRAISVWYDGKIFLPSPHRQLEK
jgi:hypothetical protein